MVRDIPDWRDKRAYEWLRHAERSAFAWEWLRRRPDYRIAALRGRSGSLDQQRWIMDEQPEAAQWGLHRFEDPSLSGPEARPVWKLSAHPFVLEARAERAGLERDTLVIDKLQRFANLVRGRTVEHLLLSDGRFSIRLDVTGPSLACGPVFLRYRLGGAKTARAPLLVLQRFLALVGSGHFSTTLHPHDTKAERHILLLRAFDAAAAGANQRSIAGELLDRDAGQMRWRIEEPSLRSRAQRLVKDSRRVLSSGYLRLLK